MTGNPTVTKTKMMIKQEGGDRFKKKENARKKKKSSREKR